MQIKINIRKNHLWTLILLVLGIGLVIAYGTNNPSQFGHSSGEIDVDYGGQTITLQQALNDISSSLSGGSGSNFTLSQVFSFPCTTATGTNVTGRWHSCSVTGVYHDDSGDDSDFDLKVEPLDQPDNMEKRSWRIINSCLSGNSHINVRCFNIF